MNDDLKNRSVQAAYWLTDIVYLRVNDEHRPGMITGIQVRANDSLLYGVTWRGGSESWHFECELSSEFVPDFGAEPKQWENV